MSSLRMYCVFDRVAGLYDAPVFVLTDGLAIRGFQDFILSGRSTVSDHVGDFELACCGSFDPVTAIVTPYDPHVIYRPASDARLMQLLDQSRGGAVGGQRPPEDSEAQPADCKSALSPLENSSSDASQAFENGLEVI